MSTMFSSPVSIRFRTKSDADRGHKMDVGPVLAGARTDHRPPLVLNIDHDDIADRARQIVM